MLTSLLPVNPVWCVLKGTLIGFPSTWRSLMWKCSPHTLAGWLHWPFAQLWGSPIYSDLCGHHNWPSPGLSMQVCHLMGCHLRPSTAIYHLWHTWGHWKWPRNLFHRPPGPDEHWLAISSVLWSHSSGTGWTIQQFADHHWSTLLWGG